MKEHEFDEEAIVQTLSSFSNSIKSRKSDTVYTIDIAKVNVVKAIQIFKKEKQNYLQRLQQWKNEQKAKNISDVDLLKDQPQEKVGEDEFEKTHEFPILNLNFLHFLFCSNGNYANLWMFGINK